MSDIRMREIDLRPADRVIEVVGLSILCPASLKTELANLAKAERRSMSAQTVLLLERGLAEARSSTAARR
jgi:hypothetical protein